MYLWVVLRLGDTVVFGLDTDHKQSVSRELWKKYWKALCWFHRMNNLEVTERGKDTGNVDDM